MLMTRSTVAHGAHLGGIIAGFLYARYIVPEDREE
jgi:membrane associated rhomboid family serine protease